MEKKRTLVVTFHTTAAAVAMEKACRQAELPGRLAPVPRQLTADCGISWRADPALREALEQLAQTQALELAGVYELEL